MKNILVTGGAGFIAFYIAKHLSNSSDQITIDTHNYKGAISIQVFDLTGNLVSDVQNRVVSLKSLSKGVYLFKITYDGNTEFVKVIKE